MSDWDMEELSWVGFVESLDPDDVPELITYLMERRLFINEPVLCGEEV